MDGMRTLALLGHGSPTVIVNVILGFDFERRFGQLSNCSHISRLFPLNVQGFAPVLERNTLHYAPTEGTNLFLQRDHVVGGANKAHINPSNDARDIAILIERTKYINISGKLCFDPLGVDRSRRHGGNL